MTDAEEPLKIDIYVYWFWWPKCHSKCQQISFKVPKWYFEIFYITSFCALFIIQ